MLDIIRAPSESAYGRLGMSGIQWHLSLILPDSWRRHKNIYKYCKYFHQFELRFSNQRLTQAHTLLYVLSIARELLRDHRGHCGICNNTTAYDSENLSSYLCEWTRLFEFWESFFLLCSLPTCCSNDCSIFNLDVYIPTTVCRRPSTVNWIAIDQTQSLISRNLDYCRQLKPIDTGQNYTCPWAILYSYLSDTPSDIANILTLETYTFRHSSAV